MLRVLVILHPALFDLIDDPLPTHGFTLLGKVDSYAVSHRSRGPGVINVLYGEGRQ